MSAKSKKQLVVASAVLILTLFVVMLILDAAQRRRAEGFTSSSDTEKTGSAPELKAIKALYNASPVEPTQQFPVVLYSLPDYRGESFGLPAGVIEGKEVFPLDHALFSSSGERKYLMPNATERGPANRTMRSIKLMPGATLKVDNVAGEKSYTANSPNVRFDIDVFGRIASGAYAKDTLEVLYTPPPPSCNSAAVSAAITEYYTKKSEFANVYTMIPIRINAVNTEATQCDVLFNYISNGVPRGSDKRRITLTYTGGIPTVTGMGTQASALTIPDAVGAGKVLNPPN